MPAGDPVQFARVAWSLVHGIAKLAVAGRFPGFAKPKILEFARFAIDASFHGLIPQSARRT